MEYRFFYNRAGHSSDGAGTKVGQTIAGECVPQRSHVNLTEEQIKASVVMNLALDAALRDPRLMKRERLKGSLGATLARSLEQAQTGRGLHHISGAWLADLSFLLVTTPSQRVVSIPSTSNHGSHSARIGLRSWQCTIRSHDRFWRAAGASRSKVHGLWLSKFGKPVSQHHRRSSPRTRSLIRKLLPAVL